MRKIIFSLAAPVDINTLVSENIEYLPTGGGLCRLCGTLIKHRPNIKRHMLDKHIDDGTAYQCPACKTIHKTKNLFQQHIYAKHKDWKGLNYANYVVQKY